MVTPPHNHSGYDNGRDNDRDRENDRSGEAAVAGLAREVEDLRRAVDQLQPLPGRVEELAETIVRLAHAVPASCNGSDGRSGSGSSGPEQRELVLTWLALGPGPEAARAVLEELVDWMRRVYLRYADGAAALPDCWVYHPDLVEELLWLMQTWQTAYGTQTTNPAHAADWHDRYRPGVVRRIKTVAGTCSVDQHRPRPGHQPADRVPEPPDGEDLEAIATWWGHHRTQPPPDPPSTTSPEMERADERHS